MQNLLCAAQEHRKLDKHAVISMSCTGDFALSVLMKGFLFCTNEPYIISKSNPDKVSSKTNPSAWDSPSEVKDCCAVESEVNVLRVCVCVGGIFEYVSLGPT